MQSVLDNRAGYQKTKLRNKNPKAAISPSRHLDVAPVASNMNRLLAGPEPSLQKAKITRTKFQEPNTNVGIWFSGFGSWKCLWDRGLMFTERGVNATPY